VPCWAISKSELTQIKGSVLANAEVSLESKLGKCKRVCLCARTQPVWVLIWITRQPAPSTQMDGFGVCQELGH
jgi:hypothetical protein